MTRGCDRVSAMDLGTWIRNDHAALATRFEQAIVAHVPAECWRDQAGPGGSSIAALLLHTAQHEDLAISTVVQGRPPLLASWRDALGIAGAPAHAGLGEREDPELTAALDLEALTRY